MSKKMLKKQEANQFPAPLQVMTPIALKGPLDQYAAESLKTTSLPLVEAEADVSFDFSEVEYIHAASLQVLVALRKDRQGAGKSVTLLNVSERVRDLFRISGTENLFEFAGGAS